jgi:PST family polysaccharide transporter
MLNDKYKVLINNFSYLVLIEVINKFLPFLVIPYIISVLGLEKYGVIAFSLAIIMYFKILTNYSFDLTATKFISQYREEKIKISKYYWNIIFTKLILVSISFSLLLLAIHSFEQLYLEKEILIYTFIMVIGEAMLPLWFFRGIEKMKYIAYLSVTTKVIYTISIFLLIKEENDYTLVALLSSLSHLIVGFFSLFYVYKRFHISFFMPSINQIKNLLYEGKDIFISNITVSMYTTTNSVLLGFLGGYTAVGIYTIAETIYGAFLQVIYTYNTVTYPYLSRFIHEKKKFILEAQKFLLYYILILMLSSLLIYLCSDFMINLVFGMGHEKSIEVLYILSLVILISPIGGFLTHYLILKSRYKIVRRITLHTMIVNFILVYPLIITYQEKGIAYLMLIVSIFMAFQNIKYTKELFFTKAKL